MVKKAKSKKKTPAVKKKKAKKAAAERVIVVSNRLPITLSRTRDMHHKLTRSSGGLISAIQPLYTTHPLVWVGSLGPGSGKDAKEKKFLKANQEYAYETVDLDRKEWQQYYNGFSNKALWPLLHYFTEHCQFDQAQWDAYVKANQKFADKVIRVSHKGDLIWVHDFHLMLVPAMVRKKRPDARIGFFLHTPFPSSEVFRIFPWRKEIMEGLLGADLIGFHTYDYLRHFRSSVLRILGLDSEMTGISFHGRYIALDAIPVGADVGQIEEILKKPKVKKNLETLSKKTADLKIMLGVDRLDYTKGIVERLEAYELFLEENANWRGKVEFFQVLVPSRTEVDSYSNLKQNIDAIVGRVNAQYGKPDWTPIRSFYRQLDMDDLVNYYSNADVAVVTPLRDGMNLVAKEYLLAQRPDSPGVLILSEFAGAVSELSDALIVNPSNTREVAESYKKALEMDSEDIRRRYKFMLKALKVYSAANWGKRFIGSLRTSSKHKQHLGPLLDKLEQRKVKKAWDKAKSRLIFLDYDGTLTDIVSVPKFAMPSWEILRLLRKLVADKRNTVMVVSGRPKRTLEEWLGKAGVALCAEHGAVIQDDGKWHLTYENTHPHWKDQIRPVMETYTGRTAGSFLEEKEEALAWHYRLSEPDYGSWQANNLAFNLESLLQGMPLQCLMGKKVVEVRHQAVNKGAAWRWLKKKGKEPDCILSIGDDKTDEDLFTALPPKATTIHVGMSESAAKYRIASPTAVRNFLKFLA